MKITDIKNASSLPDSLADAIVEQFGGLESFLEQFEDVANHGIAGGYGQFVYYSDTCAFYAANQDDIREYVMQFADELGEEPLKMVQSFNCLGEDFTLTEIGETLFSHNPDNHQTQVANALAWFVAETLCSNCYDLM